MKQVNTLILNTFCPSFQYAQESCSSGVDVGVSKVCLTWPLVRELKLNHVCSFYKYFKRSEIYFVADKNRRVLGGLYFPWSFTKVWNFWNLNWTVNLRFDIHSLSPKKLDAVIITNTHNCIQIFFMRTVILILFGFYTQIKLWLTL